MKGVGPTSRKGKKEVPLLEGEKGRRGVCLGHSREQGGKITELFISRRGGGGGSLGRGKTEGIRHLSRKAYGYVSEKRRIVNISEKKIIKIDRSANSQTFSKRDSERQA